MGAIDWEQAVALKAAGDASQDPVKEGAPEPTMTLAEAVRTVIESWNRQSRRQDTAWITSDEVDYMGFEVIRALYDQPDFPKNLTGWPALEIGTPVNVGAVPRPDEPATILPGNPPTLVEGIGPGLQVVILRVTLDFVELRIDGIYCCLRPTKEGEGRSWRVTQIEGV